MFVLSTDDGSAIRSASKVTVYHAFGDGDIRWRGKLYSVSGKQELSVSDMPVVPVKPSAPAGSGASGTKQPDERCVKDNVCAGTENHQSHDRNHSLAARGKPGSKRSIRIP